MADVLNVLSICGSLRKGSFNAALQRALPGFAPDDMKIAAAPPWASFPIYNADDQNTTGFPAAVMTLVAVRQASRVSSKICSWDRWKMLALSCASLITSMKGKRSA